MRNLTLKDLREAAPNSVLATGVVNEPALLDGPARWVAIRGFANDWAIYYHHENKGIDFVKSQGEKVLTANLITNLVPCENQVLQQYRI